MNAAELIALIAATVLAAVVAYCVWALRREHRIETRASISAPAHRVWAALTDFDSYGEWNPFITSIKGRPAEDARLEVTLAQGGGKSFRFRPRVLRVSPARQFRWFGRLGPGGLFDGEHYFVLEPQEDGTTRLTHGERFTGVLVPLMKGTLGDTARRFEAMNAALADRVAE